MFDIGFTELVLIGIVALVVIGPERLPAVARTAGQWIGKLQRFVSGVKSDLASELESGDLKKLIGDQREQINELKTLVSSTKKEFETSAKDVVQDAKKRFDEMETSLKEDEAKALEAADKLSDDTAVDGSVARTDEAANVDHDPSSTDVLPVTHESPDHPVAADQSATPAGDSSTNTSLSGSSDKDRTGT